MAPQRTSRLSTDAVRDEYLASFPSRQFQAQVDRWRERLSHQDKNLRWHRRNTFPTDCKESKANGQNFVRRTWVAQKIWKPSWGPAWPPGTYLGTLASFQQPGPRVFGANWGVGELAGRGTYIQEQLDEERAAEYNPPVDIIDDAKQVDYRATRPMFQFVAQLRLERQWLQDELKFKREEPSLDLDTLAFQSVRQFWLDQGIWRSSWRGAPQVDDEWLHESVDWETYEREREVLVNGDQEEPDDEYMNGYDKYGCRVNEAGQHIDEYGRPILRPGFDYFKDTRPGRQRILLDTSPSPPPPDLNAELEDRNSTSLGTARLRESPPPRRHSRPKKASSNNGTKKGTTLASLAAKPASRRSLRSREAKPSEHGEVTSNGATHILRPSRIRNRAASAVSVTQTDGMQPAKVDKASRRQRPKVPRGKARKA